MSLVQQLVKGVLGGFGWTAGKKIAEDTGEALSKKIKERREATAESESEEEALDGIEVEPDEEDAKK